MLGRRLPPLPRLLPQLRGTPAACRVRSCLGGVVLSLLAAAKSVAAEADRDEILPLQKALQKQASAEVVIALVDAHPAAAQQLSITESAALAACEAQRPTMQARCVLNSPCNTRVSICFIVI